MKKAFIGTYFDSKNKATNFARRMVSLKKINFFVMESTNGYFVVSENQIKKLVPQNIKDIKL